MPVQVFLQNFNDFPADLGWSKLAAEPQAAFIQHLQVHQAAVDFLLRLFALGNINGVTGQQVLYLPAKSGT